MKNTISPILIAFAVTLTAALSVYGQTSVATVPVGFQQATVAAATDSSNPASTVISVPFYNPAAYVSLVTSVDGTSTFSSSSAAWTTGQFAAAAAPFFVHFKSGSSVGRYFLITANTATQLTVDNRGYNLTAVVAANNSFEILPANTLGLLFGMGSVPFLTGSNANVADNVLLWDGTAWLTYYHNGVNWKRAGSLANQNNAICYPDEGIYITRRATTPLTLTFLGTVPSVAESSDLVGPGSTFVANRFPTDTTLANFGFQNLPNWLSGNNATVADNVLLWDGTAWLTYYYTGTNWKRAGSLSNQNAQVIPAGTAAYVTRQSTATTTSASLVQPLPYSL